MVNLEPRPNQCILVTGPARSGKSEWAEHLAIASGYPVTYIATAQIDETDTEWQARIEQHQQRRPSTWTTRHVPLDLDQAIMSGVLGQCLLVDSLGTWLTNRLVQDDPTWQQSQRAILDALKVSASHIILVAEETGWGVVPAYPLGRRFRDRLGQLVRQVSAIADATYLVTAGYALNLTQLGHAIDRATS